MQSMICSDRNVIRLGLENVSSYVKVEQEVHLLRGVKVRVDYLKGTFECLSY